MPTYPNPRFNSLETFDLNGFEQLCKNYAVEKTRFKFLQDEVCSGAGEGATGGGLLRGRNARDVADLVGKSRQLLAMFEGEEKVRGKRQR